MSEMICIVCPQGCHLRVEEESGAVSGNRCPRGEDYALSELRNPVRTVTSTVRVAGGRHPRCPVKTGAPIPKAQVTAALAALDAVELVPPIRLGQVVLEDVCGTGIPFVATRSM